VNTWSFPARGGTMWDDLEQDRPWFDECLEADRRQDAIAADAAAALEAPAPPWELVDLERFGPLELLEAVACERPARADTPPAPTARPAWVDNDDLTRARRRRVLAEALEWGTTVAYYRPRKGTKDARTRPARRRAV
jgi:hypothetical protein